MTSFARLREQRSAIEFMMPCNSAPPGASSMFSLHRAELSAGLADGQGERNVNRPGRRLRLLLSRRPGVIYADDRRERGPLRHAVTLPTVPALT